MKSIFDPSNKFSINQKFRKKRFDFFLQFIKQQVGKHSSFSILDIGGTQEYWENMGFFAVFPDAKITLVNLDKEEVRHPNFISTIGNACNLTEFADKSFDLVYSNSVIEHLYNFSQQQKMAKEVLRIGKNHFIQTPNYYFPIEPHWMVPFFQFFPKDIKIMLTSNFTLGHIKKAQNKMIASDRVNEVRLLTTKEMQEIFPDSKIYKEYFLGLVKSISMYH